MRKILTAAFILLASTASAQVQEVPANKPYTVEFDHDGVSTVDYPILLDGQEVMRIPVSQLLAGTVRQVMAPVSRGNHILVACARSLDRQVCGIEKQFVAIDIPKAPGVIRILVEQSVVLNLNPATGEVVVESLLANSRIVN
jgi:hypothetical protein